MSTPSGITPPGSVDSSFSPATQISAAYPESWSRKRRVETTVHGGKHELYGREPKGTTHWTSQLARPSVRRYEDSTASPRPRTGPRAHRHTSSRSDLGRGSRASSRAQDLQLSSTISRKAFA